MEPDKEEVASEQQALQVVKEDEVRAKIIEDYGFDETNDAERIDKLVAKEIEHSKKLSSVIGQKIKWRLKASEGKEVPPNPAQKKEEVKSELSSLDILAITRNQIPEEDTEDVLEYARFKKISVADALKSTYIKTVLAEKAEFRKSAEASNTGTGKRINSKVSEEALLSGLSKGEVPESKEEAEKLFWARRGGKRD